MVAIVKSISNENRENKDNESPIAAKATSLLPVSRTLLCEKNQHGIDRVYQRSSRASQHLGQFDAGATSVKHEVMKTLHDRRNCKAGGKVSAETDPAPSSETHHDKTKIDRGGSKRGRSLPLHGGPKAAETAPENRRN